MSETLRGIAMLVLRLPVVRIECSKSTVLVLGSMLRIMHWSINAVLDIYHGIVGDGLGMDADVDVNMLLAMGTLSRALEHRDGAVQVIHGLTLRAREESLTSEDELIAFRALYLVVSFLLPGSLEQILRSFDP